MARASRQQRLARATRYSRLVRALRQFARAQPSQMRRRWSTSRLSCRSSVRERRVRAPRSHKSIAPSTHRPRANRIGIFLIRCRLSCPLGQCISLFLCSFCRSEAEVLASLGSHSAWLVLRLRAMMAIGLNLVCVPCVSMLTCVAGRVGQCGAPLFCLFCHGANEAWLVRLVERRPR